MLIAFVYLSALNSGIPCLARQQEEADEKNPPVVSSQVADIELSNVMDGTRKQVQETGLFSNEAKATLKRSLKKQYDSFVSNFKNEKSLETDPALLKRFELLTEKRDAFVDERLNVATSELTGVAVNGMEYQAFLDVCTQLEIRVSLNGAIIEGAPFLGTKIVTLMLPKMDCPGCANIVRDQLGKIEGVFDSATNVKQGNCRVQVSVETKLDEKLDELAKTVVQFQEWTAQ